MPFSIQGTRQYERTVNFKRVRAGCGEPEVQTVSAEQEELCIDCYVFEHRMSILCRTKDAPRVISQTPSCARLPHIFRRALTCLFSFRLSAEKVPLSKMQHTHCLIAHINTHTYTHSPFFSSSILTLIFQSGTVASSQRTTVIILPCLIFFFPPRCRNLASFLTNGFN